MKPMTATVAPRYGTCLVQCAPRRGRKAQQLTRGNRYRHAGRSPIDLRDIARQRTWDGGERRTGTIDRLLRGLTRKVSNCLCATHTTSGHVIVYAGFPPA